MSDRALVLSLAAAAVAFGIGLGAYLFTRFWAGALQPRMGAAAGARGAAPCVPDPTTGRQP